MSQKSGWLTFVVAFVAIVSGFFGSAQSVLDQTEWQHASPEQIEKRFLLGLTNLEAGRPDVAIPHFLEILSAEPSPVRVRLELARAYFEARQWSRAREEFFTVLSGDLPEPVRQKVLEFIRAIDARRGFDWDLQIGFVNAGSQRKYDSDSIDLNFFGVALPFSLDRDTSSRIGVRAVGAANFRRPVNLSVGDQIAATAFAEGFFDITDAPGSDYDDYIIGTRAGLRFSGLRTTFSLAPVFSTRFLAGERYEDQLGLELSFESRTPLGFSVFGFGSYARVNNRVADNLDGHLGQAQLGVRRSLAARAQIGLSVYVEDKHVVFDLEDYRLAGTRLFGSVDVPFGLTLRPAVFIERKSFRNPSPLFTASPDERSYGTSLRIEKNDIFLGNGFSPFVDVRCRRTKSDITAFSYKETRVEFGLERRF